jgi:hypothetical protein
MRLPSSRCDRPAESRALRTYRSNRFRSIDTNNIRATTRTVKDGNTGQEVRCTPGVVETMNQLGSRLITNSRRSLRGKRQRGS